MDSESDVEQLVDAELSRMPERLLAHLREVLVAPRQQDRHVRSCSLKATECWVVAEHGDEVIAYCDGPDYGPYRWAVLERDSEDLGTDDRYHASLREAFELSGWDAALDGQV